MDQETPIELEIRQQCWLNAYREVSTISYACRKTNTTRDEVRTWCLDPVFSQAKQDVELDVNDELDEHMLNIAMGKMRRPILDKTGKQVSVSSEDGTLVTPAWEVIRSDAITIAVAKARMPDKYADVTIDLGSMSDEQLRNLSKRLGRAK